jgi:hypothetical protein
MRRRRTSVTDIDVELAKWRNRRLDATTDLDRGAASREIDALLEQRKALMASSEPAHDASVHG